MKEKNKRMNKEYNGREMNVVAKAISSGWFLGSLCLNIKATIERRSFHPCQVASISKTARKGVRYE
jgi:hypothetical protein